MWLVCVAVDKKGFQMNNNNALKKRPLSGFNASKLCMHMIKSLNIHFIVVDEV